MESIYYNGKIITMDAENAEKEILQHLEAVLVKDGIIKSIGKLDKVREQASKEAEYVDLNGKCLMPAFIDAHSHVIMTGQMGWFADLTECTSFEDIVMVLNAYTRKNHIPSNGFVIGFGYDHNSLKEGKHPDKTVLDQVSPDIPIIILHVSAHMACVNSAALNICGINEGTPDPVGGVLGRMPYSAEPNGYLEEAGMALVLKKMMSGMQMDHTLLAEKMQEVYIENGITTVQDGASNIGNLQLLAEMADRQQLKVDVVAYPVLSEDGTSAMEQFYGYYGKYKNHLKLGGYKLVLDGSPQGRSAWMTEPYLGSQDGYCGYPYMSDEQVENYIFQAVSEGCQVLAHCNGDAASEQFLSAYEAVAAKKENADKLRPVMIHCQTVRNDQLERMAALGMIASVFVGHVWYWGNIHIKNFGSRRGNHISPVKDAIERGVLVNFHQDSPVTKPRMLHSVWCAVNRLSKDGNTVGGDQKVEVYEALKAVTIRAAYEYFEEKEKGSIAIGKKADLVILDKSPLEVESEEIKNIQVLKTIKDGKVIFEQ